MLNRLLKKVHSANGDLAKVSEILNAKKLDAKFFSESINDLLSKRQDAKIVKMLEWADLCGHITDAQLLDLVIQALDGSIQLRMAVAFDAVMKFALNNDKFTDDEYQALLTRSKEAYCG